MPPPDHPLPDCLTRFLAAPGSHAGAPTPGDRTRTRAPDRSAGTPNRATDGLIVRTMAYGVAGLVWIGIAWQALHRLSG